MGTLRSSSQYYHVVLSRIPPRATPVFHEEEMQRRVWGRRWGVYNDVGTLRTILLHPPGEEILVMTSDKYDPEIDALIDDEEQWYFRDDRGPDLVKMQDEFAALVRVLETHGVEIVTVGGAPRDPNAMFVRDCGMVVKGGAIISRMGPVGKAHGTGRRGEERFVLQKLAEIGMPILRTIAGDGLLEGGSFCFLDEKHAAIGLSFRGNPSGAEQLRHVLQYQEVELIQVPLPGYAMHLDGGIVMVDHDKALLNVERLPYWFLDTLDELGIQKIPADYREGSMAVNCLTLSPGKVIMDDRAVYTAERLASFGMETILIPWEEISKHGGGIHCSTLPLVRERS